MKTFCAFAAIMLLVAVGATAETTNALSKAEIEGRELARQLCEARPETNSVMTGMLKIRDKEGMTKRNPIKFNVIVTKTNWVSVYEKVIPELGSGYCRLTVTRDASNSNRFEISSYIADPETHWTKDKSEVAENCSFAGDFWVVDMSLEFFHWPAQKVLKKEVKRSRGCTVLESTNPSPATNGYSRVVSWIDHESGGIVQAEAYDFSNKLLKEFAPKSFKKVNGQWLLQEMEIRNVQTGSRTRLEFDLAAE